MALATLGTMAWECTPMRSTRCQGNESLDQKFGLLAFLERPPGEIGRRDGIPVDLG